MKRASYKEARGSKWLYLIISILIGIAGGIYGGKIINSDTMNVNGEGMELLQLLWFLVAIYITQYLHIIIHEGGHFLFGKLSGYQFSSFRIKSLMLLREEGQLKWKKYNIVGTGGQCLMVPPQTDRYQFPFVLYNLGGSLMNLIISILCLFLNMTIVHNHYLVLFFGGGFIIGISSVIMNGIPLKINGIANDGMNILSMRKDREARRAFWLQLQVNGLLVQGTRMRDIPTEYVELPNEIDLSNSLNCSLVAIRCSYFHDRMEFEQAKELSNYLMHNASGMMELQKNELRCELLFYELIGECRQEVINRIYTKQLKKYVKATSNYVSRRRLLYAYELLAKHNQEGANKQMIDFEKVAKSYPYRSIVEAERELLEWIEKKASKKESITV